MINISLKKQQRGAAILITAVVLVILSTLMIIFAANYGQTLTKITANQTRTSQSFEAADAGVEFGINYLNQNNGTILANPVSGFITPYSDSNTTNVTFANNSKFTVVYTNPVSGNYQLILITSTGTSDDGLSTSVVKQLVQFGSMLASPPSNPLTSLNDVSIGGSGTITNTSSATTIRAGDNLSFSGNGKTVTSSGGSSNGHIGSDVQSNISSLTNLSSNDFFATYFGQSPTTIKNGVAHYYANSADTNYSSTLSGMSGTSVWIEQTAGTATINGNTTIGTSTNPVLLIVNGPLQLSGNVTFNGIIFVLGSNPNTDVSGSITGSLTINGGILAANTLNISGNTNVTFNPTILTNLTNNSTMRYYAKVPGSWKDF